MLADNQVKIDESILPNLRYPLMISPKIDGIRLRVDPTLNAVSRTHKPIPNTYIQETFAKYPALHWLDGEGVVGAPTDPNVFNRSQSAIMTQGDRPLFDYYVFDYWAHPDTGYDIRLQFAKDIVRLTPLMHNAYEHRVILLPQIPVLNPEDVQREYEKYVAEGFEGAILRSTTGRYKNGRSTFKEHLLLKYKPRQDSEATIVGFQQLMRNQNEQTRDVFGYARRSSHQAGKVAVDLLGALLVTTETWGDFAIGSGLDDDLRAEIWKNQGKYLGKKCSFTFTPKGMKDKPRFPIFKGIRHD